MVTFVADGTDGVFGGGKREVVVATDLSGRASVVLTLGRRAGHHRVRAEVTGVAGEALFVVRALAGRARRSWWSTRATSRWAWWGRSCVRRLPPSSPTRASTDSKGRWSSFDVIEGDGVLQNGERDQSSS